MIIERLRAQKGFTETEKSIASYLLEHDVHARSLSIGDLADATFSSPASITRLCQKLGLSGFREFSIRFSAEVEETARKRTVSFEVPFDSGDSYEEVAWNMGNLAAQSINDVMQELDYPKLKGIVDRIVHARVINVFSTGVSLNAALDFKVKMVRLGKQINVEQDSAMLPGYAFSSDEDCFALLLSQSGETRRILECARILRERKCFSVAITAKPQSTLAQIANEKILTPVSEGSGSIEAFASFYAIHYVLDCLYSWVYLCDYEKHLARSNRNNQLIDWLSRGK